MDFFQMKGREVLEGNLIVGYFLENAEKGGGLISRCGQKHNGTQIYSRALMPTDHTAEGKGLFQIGPVHKKGPGVFRWLCIELTWIQVGRFQSADMIGGGGADEIIG